MNQSKARQGSRFWKKWADAGAVDYTISARAMGTSIFGYDPLIGCPFDDAEMVMVKEDSGFKIGAWVTFRGPNRIWTTIFPTIRGRIIAIGKNAKYLNGEPFTALAIQVGSGIYFKTNHDIGVKPPPSYCDMTDAEIKAAAKNIIASSSSQEEVCQRIRDELKYPYGNIALYTLIPNDAIGVTARELVRGLGGLVMKNGAMAMAMMHGHNGTINL